MLVNEITESGEFNLRERIDGANRRLSTLFQVDLEVIGTVRR